MAEWPNSFERQTWSDLRLPVSEDIIPVDIECSKGFIWASKLWNLCKILQKYNTTINYSIGNKHTIVNRHRKEYLCLLYRADDSLRRAADHWKVIQAKAAWWHNGAGQKICLPIFRKSAVWSGFMPWPADHSLALQNPGCGCFYKKISKNLGKNEIACWQTLADVLL